MHKSPLHTAITLLSKKEYSKQQIKKKLSARFPNVPDIDDILIYCEQHGYLDENRFTELRIRALMRLGKGTRWIQNDLKNKGISDEMIAKHLAIIDNSWLDAAKHALQKRFGKPAKTLSERSRQMRFLQQRGFTEEEIRSVLRSTQNRWSFDDDN